MSEFGVPAASAASVVPAIPPQTIPEGKLLSPGAVAKLFGVDPRTVTRWVDKGLLTPILTPGGHRRYRYLDVMALRDNLQQRSAPLAERSTPSTATPSI